MASQLESMHPFLLLVKDLFFVHVDEADVLDTTTVTYVTKALFK